MQYNIINNTTMGKPVETNENIGLSDNAGNASLTDLIKGKLKDKTWKTIIIVGLVLVVGFLLLAVL